MKKLISLLLAFVMVAALAAGCSMDEKNDETTGETTGATNETPAATDNVVEDNAETTAPIVEEEIETPVVEAEGALLVLENIWAQFSAEDKENFPVQGGDAAAMFAQMEANPEFMPDGPGKFNLTEVDELVYQKLVPEAEVANITDAATMNNMMNGNLFTCGVYAVADADSFIAAMKDSVLNNQWMCGMPDTLKIAKVDGCVLVVWGTVDAFNIFDPYFAAAYPAAEIVVNEAVAG